VGIAGKEKAAAKESGFGKDEGVIGFGFRQQPGPPELEGTLVSTAMSMARRGPATINDGQTLFQELLAFRLRELVHLRTVILNNPSANRFLG
jgi:hypothetical protein